MFMVDGFLWDIPCDITRHSEVRPSEISGIMLDRSYFNDVLGTYMRYEVKLAVPLDQRDFYNQVYEVLNQPVDGHEFLLPYNTNFIAITARVENISDVYVRLPNGGVYWKGITFEVISNAPSKAMSLSEALTRGRAPIPDVATPAQGTSYTWDGYEWVPAVVYADADDIEY